MAAASSRAPSRGGETSSHGAWWTGAPSPSGGPHPRPGARRPRHFDLTEVPTPSPDDVPAGGVLLRVLAGGICGSDLPAWKGMRSLQPSDRGLHAAGIPGFPMHEVVGEVVHSEHQRLRVGDRVVGWAAGFDGLAEYVVTPGDAVGGYDPTLTPEIAVMLQPLACVLHAVERLPSVAGAHVAVLGLGPIGLLFAHVLASAGARVIGVDRVDRTEVAERYRLDDVVASSADRWAAGLAPADRPAVVVEAIGHQVGTLTDAVVAAAPRGVVFYFGVPDDAVYPLPMLTFLRKDLTLVSGVTRDYARGIADAGEYVRTHPALLADYVTHVLPFERATEAYDLAERPARGQRKVVVRMGAGG
jgi:L-iditol 2-dehydrogenase